MAAPRKGEFPYPIHPLANLGEMQEAAILELMDDIKKYGYNPDFPLKVMGGKLLDGRHRQEACLRLSIVPPVDVIRPKGGAAAFVAQVNSLKTYRIIKPKERLIYGVEHFPTDGPAALCKRMGLKTSSSNLASFTLKAYKKSRRWAASKGENPWDRFKRGEIGRRKLADDLGIPHGLGTGGESWGELKSTISSKDETIEVLESDLTDLQEQVASRDARIKELERRVKSLDPQERVYRAAHGEESAEDALRDRLEHAEDDIKKQAKINEKLTDQIRSQERIGARIADALTGIDWGAPVFPPVSKSPGKARPHEFLALMSDAHYGEVVDPEATLGISYNTDIARRRIEHYRDVVCRYKELRETSYDVPKLTIAVLGDMLSGMIHEELMATNEINVTEQSAQMANILWGLCKDFASEFEQVEMILVPGNHPRLSRKPQFKEKWNNFEYGMGQGIEMALSESKIPNVTLQRPKSFVYLHEIFGRQIAMYHGDGIKSASFAGIPFYGLKQQREAMQSLLSVLGAGRASMLVMGHFHQHIYWKGPDCDVLINGSLKGPDEYIMTSRLAANPAEQVLLEFHPEHGLVNQAHIDFAHLN